MSGVGWCRYLVAKSTQHDEGVRVFEVDRDGVREAGSQHAAGTQLSLGLLEWCFEKRQKSREQNQ